MFIVESYFMAVCFCVITMLCWGSWANTQKLVQNKWRFELFYWDYVIGIFLFSLLGAFTLGSIGESGRPFLQDLVQADPKNMISAMVGGLVFNLANILLTAAIASAGMAVAFPIGIGLALIIGVIINYVMRSHGDPLLLFLGVALVAGAVIINAIAYNKHAMAQSKKGVGKWVAVSIVAGILMSTFYPFVASGMDLDNFAAPIVGKMTPYTAFVMFCTGVLISNFLFNTILMRRPLEGQPISYREYFEGRMPIHLIGVLGGGIWGLGNLFNLVAAGEAGPAISYGLGQGAPLVAALWGVFVWKEFKNPKALVKLLLATMFISFIAGLLLIIASGA